ncbi:uncharacterized protein KGF55_003530 [Candida pseudojiufengensis]|uniref:uncharacterized protein n=1 Tax=Candida pseudojiufengensis TaxID=497109 RepID=UPI0022255BDA|nr:uncharacterized protein KGF55_003530 [Candida pseudojiufengensis]KAI5962454.1 hypothetical protein KGF55_003530 [Candida pseudojiufengensis]
MFLNWPNFVLVSFIFATIFSKLINLDLLTPSSKTIKTQKNTSKTYSIESLEKLLKDHAELLDDENNIFYFKSTNSSLQYDQSEKNWIEFIVVDGSYIPTLHNMNWIPISSCLESIHGSGGYLSRYTILYLDTTIENNLDLSMGVPFYFSEGISLAIGVRIGYGKLITLLFSCSINPGEIGQLFIKPKYIITPNIKSIIWKFKNKKMNKIGLKYIKPFKMLVIETPEHQCWVSRDINNLQCSKIIEDKVDITME